MAKKGVRRMALVGMFVAATTLGMSSASGSGSPGWHLDPGGARSGARVAASPAPATADAYEGQVIDLTSDFLFKPGKFTIVQDFEPGALKLPRLSPVRFYNNPEYLGAEGHTVTFTTDLADIPTDIFSAFGCYDPGAICDEALTAHFPGGEEGEEVVPVVKAGKSGFDTRGDSLLLDVGQKYTAKLTAPVGSTLYFTCAFHPWMAGKIKVAPEAVVEG